MMKKDTKRAAKPIIELLKKHSTPTLKLGMITIKSYCDHCGTYDDHWSTDCTNVGEEDKW